MISKLSTVKLLHMTTDFGFILSFMSPCNLCLKYTVGLKVFKITTIWVEVTLELLTTEGLIIQIIENISSANS